MDESAVEVKRMFVEPDCRGRGIARRLLAELEECARRAGYSVARLETGVRQPEAIGLYESAGYRRIPNYGMYAGIADSACFEKSL
jgi:GNAT superfamily N-acetyltransferase